MFSNWADNISIVKVYHNTVIISKTSLIFFSNFKYNHLDFYRLIFVSRIAFKDGNKVSCFSFLLRSLFVL